MSSLLCETYFRCLPFFDFAFPFDLNIVRFLAAIDGEVAVEVENSLFTSTLTSVRNGSVDGVAEVGSSHQIT